MIRQDLERRILTILSERLMELVKVFAREYIAERNRLAAAHVGDWTVKEKGLAKVIRDQDVFVPSRVSLGLKRRFAIHKGQWITFH